MKVFLIGTGMGTRGSLTVGALEAIEGSGLLIGASRLLEPFDYLDCERRALIRADEIAQALEQASCEQASVLLSGDVGFYSGAKRLYDVLDGFDVEVIPGISSVVYFCAKLHVSWQDVALVSAHGREHNAVGVIQAQASTFCLTGGATKVQDIVQQLVERGLGEVRLAVGERLSYPDERIVQGTARELLGKSFADLSVLLAQNPHPIEVPYRAPALSDGAFQRGAVPMTKEEVRMLAVSKLRIAPDHVVWDVGAGTGSITIEAARAALNGMVYAIERNEAACDLVRANCAALGACNVAVVPGKAPDALRDLPAPDRVFIGGSSGTMSAIVDAVAQANPLARVCVTAVTLETLGAVLDVLRERGIADADIVQVSVARADSVGPYHLMRAENPVYLATFDLGCAPQEQEGEGLA